MKEVIQNHIAGYQQIGTTSTEQKHPIGFRAQAKLNTAPDTVADFIYFKAAGPLALNAAVIVNGVTAKAANAFLINEYGWAKVNPPA